MGLHDGHRQRKQERFLAEGLGGFADHEVLELLLYYAIPRRDTNETAHRLLERFGTLQNVLNAHPRELEKVPGVGPNAAVLLHLTAEVQRRASRGEAASVILNSVEKCGAYFQQLLAAEKHEVLYQACLDGKGKLILCKKLADGNIDSAALSVRQVVSNAVLHEAAAVVLAHNHPSGVALPSENDRAVTLLVRDALRMMDIRLLDHIVVADGDFVSMAQSGFLL